MPVPDPYFSTMKEHPRIIFFGTPDFAVPSLKLLTEEHYQVVAVVTAPDKPAGRGLRIHHSPVKEFALSKSIPVLQPPSLKEPGFLTHLADLKPDLQIVIAFRMMPRAVWSLPPLGTFNLHASLLPQYRGAAPINRALMNGEKESGLTTFLLNDHIDTGNILLTEKVLIGSDETAGELHDRMKILGAPLVIRTVEGLVNRSLIPVEQPGNGDSQLQFHTAPKLFRDDCRIDWCRDVHVLHNQIRGLSPHPGAYTEIMVNNETYILKVLRAFPEPIPGMAGDGQIRIFGKEMLRVAAGNGYLVLTEVQLQGKRVMKVPEFLRGYQWLFAESHGF